jgi:cytosine/adenosine deaminase-related metal-dependent hydrolase
VAAAYEETTSRPVLLTGFLVSLELSGTVVPLRPGEEEAAFAGAVWFADDGTVAAVTEHPDGPPAGMSDVPNVDVGDSFIYPGLIDLHSHLAYNTLPLWVDPGQTAPYLHHDIWPGEPSYADAISWPGWTLLDRAPECVLAYVQVRALAGGTTSIQGWPNVSRSPTNALVRSVERDRLGPLPDPVAVSALTQTLTQLSARAVGMQQGQAFIYHCAEGQPGSIVEREFDDVDTAGCLTRGLAAVHCSALDGSHFALWRNAAGAVDGPAGTVVWSPFSNLWLYGITTDVPAARSNGLTVCLGSDWGPSGTKNLLGEMKVARLWSDRQGWDLSDFDLVKMVTASPGDFLARAWNRPVGRLAETALGDALVVARRRSDPWENLVAARESDVLLVVVGGRARYGTYTLMRAAGESITSPVRLGRIVRRVVLSRPDDPAQPWSWDEVVERLDAVRDDAAVHPPTGPAGSAGGPLPGPSARFGDPLGTPTLVARPDMPGGPAQAAGPPPVGQTVQIPALEPVFHGPTWLSGIIGRGFHGGALDDLASFYQ